MFVETSGDDPAYETNLKLRGCQIAVLLSVAFLPGCGASAPYDEHIQGVIRQDGRGVPSTHVRFTSSDAEEVCGATNTEALTDEQGRFLFRLRYQPSITERFAVVVHHYRLCVLDSNGWHPIWNFATGPAPKRVEFKCDLSAGTTRQRCVASWEGQAFR
jgi:hypothetical protein